MTVCVINGENVNEISALDRGLAYGDGVFTTAKIVSGKIEMLTAHLERLRGSCQVLFIEGVDYDTLIKQLTLLAKEYQLAVLKVIITAGQGGRGYSRVGAEQPNVIITINTFPEHYKDWQLNGIILGNSDLKIGLNPLLAGIKHLNRLEQVLLRKELDEQPLFNDLIVYDLNQHIIETTSSNLFWQKNGQWFTPMITDSGVKGLKRQAILAKFPDIVEIAATQKVLAGAEALFICNSIMDIVPVRQYQQEGLSIIPVLEFANRFHDDKDQPSA